MFITICYKLYGVSHSEEKIIRQAGFIEVVEGRMNTGPTEVRANL